MDLRDAIEHLYETFAPYRASRVAGCPCCVSPEEQARLHARRLRELSEDDLSSYAMSALNTWGTLSDLKHFFPRILELKASGELWTDLQILYGKIAQEGPWPDHERHAIERFTRALLAAALTGQVRCPILDILESAGVAGFDVRALLEHGFGLQGRALDPARASQLAELVLARSGALAWGELGWIWWRAYDGSVEAWLLSSGARESLMNTFEAHPEHSDAGRWAEAYDVLEALRAATTA